MPNETVVFSEVYRENVAFVWRSLRRLGVCERYVDDVCQEVFVIVHRKLSTFDATATMRTWLFGIARRVAGHSEPTGASPRVAEAAARVGRQRGRDQARRRRRRRAGPQQCGSGARADARTPRAVPERRAREERDRIAIEALARLEGVERARAAADRFFMRYPQSIYRSRIESLLR